MAIVQIYESKEGTEKEKEKNYPQNYSTRYHCYTVSLYRFHAGCRYSILSAAIVIHWVLSISSRHLILGHPTIIFCARDVQSTVRFVCCRCYMSCSLSFSFSYMLYDMVYLYLLPHPIVFLFILEFNPNQFFLLGSLCSRQYLYMGFIEGPSFCTLAFKVFGTTPIRQTASFFW